MRSYEVARRYFGFLEGAAWTGIVLGGIIALAGFGGGSQVSTAMAVAAGSPGILICVLCFFGLVYVQSGRASVDTAEMAQQSLKTQRDQLAISKQLLRLAGGEEALATYVAETGNSSDDLSDISFDTDQPDPLEPTKKPDVLEVIKYRGAEIERLEEHHRIGADYFQSLEIAKAAIDKPMMYSTLKMPVPVQVEQETTITFEPPSDQVDADELDVPSEPVPEPEPAIPLDELETLETFQHHGATIDRLEIGYRTGGELFPSLDAAQQAIDNPNMRPLLAQAYPQ